MILTNAHDYADKAARIRQDYSYARNDLERDSSRTPEYKAAELKRIKEEAQQKMAELRGMYKREQEVVRQMREQDAFRPSGSPGEYFAVLNQADGATKAERERMARNALSMGTGDIIKAVAQAALNACDAGTLQIIMDSADESITKPIDRAMEARTERSANELAFEIGTFTV